MTCHCSLVPGYALSPCSAALFYLFSPSSRSWFNGSLQAIRPCLDFASDGSYSGSELEMSSKVSDLLPPTCLHELSVLKSLISRSVGFVWYNSTTCKQLFVFAFLFPSCTAWFSAQNLFSHEKHPKRQPLWRRLTSIFVSIISHYRCL